MGFNSGFKGLISSGIPQKVAIINTGLSFEAESVLTRVRSAQLPHDAVLCIISTDIVASNSVAGKTCISVFSCLRFSCLPIG